MARTVGSDIVILDVDSGTYYALNETGAFIWDRIGMEATRDELIDAVVTAFEVDREQARCDIDELVADLVERGLIAP